MRRLWIATLVGAMTVSACAGVAGAPASPPDPAVAGLATNPPTSVPAEVKPSIVPARPTPMTTPSEPIPDAMIGAWYHPAPAYWWFLRAGSPTCVLVAHTDVDCVAYQLVGQPAYVGAATMAGRVLRIRWVRGYCAGDRTNFGTGVAGDTLKLFDLPDDCGGANFVLSRAGIGTTPNAPPPPAN